MKKVAVSAGGEGLDAQVDQRFGRCAYFVIVDVDDMSFRSIDNSGSGVGGGAGIQAAREVASAGVSAVITGNVGPNAVRTLNAAGIEVYTGQSGTVEHVVHAYRNGTMKPTKDSTVGEHYGMKGSPAA